jgi:hypothetical protein
MELTKAELALRLDRNYGQDEELFKNSLYKKNHAISQD